MNTSLFELFKIGIGPSSSHTVGPMRAALRFVEELGPLDAVTRVQAELYGSLAHTGRGHSTDCAILLGLSGEQPDQVDPSQIETILARIRNSGCIKLNRVQPIAFNESSDLLFDRDQRYPPGALAETSHPNGMCFAAFDQAGQVLSRSVFYSVGGGFILSAAELAPDPIERKLAPRQMPYPFASARELLAVAEQHKTAIAEIILTNEAALYAHELQDPSSPRIRRPGLTEADKTDPPHVQIEKSILALWHAMQASTDRGLTTEGILPGGLNVRRRAPRLHERILALDQGDKPRDPLAPLDWVSLFAIAVNEENAAGGRVVTRPHQWRCGRHPRNRALLHALHLAGTE